MTDEEILKRATQEEREEYDRLAKATYYTNWVWIQGFMRDSEYNKIIDRINREVIEYRLRVGGASIKNADD